MPRGKGPDFTGFGGYGPWPDNDVLGTEADPSPHYYDGFANRAPAGCHIEGPADYWIDCMVYPKDDRIIAGSAASADYLDHGSRAIQVTVGNLTGKRPGPNN